MLSRPVWLPVLAALFVLTALTACGPRVRIDATLPATKIDLAKSGVTRIAVPDLMVTSQADPSGAVALGEDLRSALVSLGRFEVLDRTAVQSLLKEHQFNASGLVDSTTAAADGRFTGATALIVGTVTTYGYAEELSRSQYRYTDEKGRERTATGYQLRGNGSIQVAFKLVDVASGRLIAATSCVSSQAVRSPRDGHTDGEQPAPIDHAALMASLRAAAVAEFTRQIAPTPIQDEVTLETNGDIPAIAAGNQSAELGDWAEARAHFQEATKATPPSTAAYFNLGIACRALGDFPAAQAAFKEAFKLSNSQVYLKEIEKTKVFAAGAAQQ
jgi:curli biogenesis system outer membrane secretion channel CsgG